MLPQKYLLLVLSALFCEISATVFERNGAQAQTQSIQMEQEQTEQMADKVMTDLMSYWQHQKEINAHNSVRAGPLRIVGFSWSDCGQAGDPMHVSQLVVGPDPIKLPGNVALTVHGSLEDAVAAPIQLSVEVYKKVLIWVKVPCIDGLGSCSYDDACALDPFNNKPCPPPFVKAGIPCKCPVKPGTYSLDSASFLVDPPGIPSWLEDGSYRVTAHMTKNGKEFGCVNVAFSVTK